MDWPEEGELLIKSLATDAQHSEKVAGAKLLGSDTGIRWEQTSEGLSIQFPSEKPGDYAYAIEVVISE